MTPTSSFNSGTGHITKDDPNAQLLHKINSLFEPIGVVISGDHIMCVKDNSTVPAKVTAYVTCAACSNEKRKKSICVQYIFAKNSSKGYWNLSNFISHLKKKHTRDANSQKKVDASLDVKKIKLEPNDSFKPRLESSLESSTSLD